MWGGEVFEKFFLAISTMLKQFLKNLFYLKKKTKTKTGVGEGVEALQVPGDNRKTLRTKQQV